MRKRKKKAERGKRKEDEERGIYLFVLYPWTSFIGKWWYKMEGRYDSYFWMKM